jgi:hypothetical protein
MGAVKHISASGALITMKAPHPKTGESRDFKLKVRPEANADCVASDRPFEWRQANNSEDAQAWVKAIQAAGAAAETVTKPKGADPQAKPGRARQSVDYPGKFTRRQAPRTLQPDRATSKQLTSSHHEALKQKLKVGLAIS